LAVKTVLAPEQILVTPVMFTVGLAFTVIGAVAVETQPELVSVYEKVAVPFPTPVTTPALVTVATPGELLTHVPPVVGDKVVVEPTHIVLGPVTLTSGRAFTVMVTFAVDGQLVTF